MVLGSPDADARAEFAFWAPSGAEEVDNSADVDVLCGQSHLNVGDNVNDEKRRSMYVIEFEEMLKTVLEQEYFLFDEIELRCFDAYTKLTYEARYLLVRLCLRKSDQWIRQGDLKYQRELGDKIPDAMRELASRKTIMEQEHAVKVEEHDSTNLFFDGDKLLAGSSKTEEKYMPPPDIPQLPAGPDYTVFADDGSSAGLRELLGCLKREELQKLVKDFRLKASSRDKPGFINTLINSTTTQSILVTKKGKGKAVEKPLKQTTLDIYAGRKTTQQDRLREITMKTLGAVIRLNEDVIDLFRRVNIVYFRSTQYSPSLMTNAILARAKRRTYANYVQTRTTNIWSTRQALLTYEEALKLEALVDELFCGMSNDSARARSRSSTRKTPVLALNISSVEKRTEFGASLVKKSKGEEDNSLFLTNVDLSEEKESARVQDAKAVMTIFTNVYDRWKALVAEEGKTEGRARGLERFHYGHVLTRIVCKGAHALHILKDFQTELDVLEELLKQRRWRRGRRGGWHERRALVLMTHMGKEHNAYKKAHEGVWDALRDEDTHIVYRPKLRRRLVTLEKKLKIPEDERHICVGGLKKAEEIYIEGERIRTTFDASGKPVHSNTKKVEDRKQQFLFFNQESSSFAVSQALPVNAEPQTRTPSVTGRTVWRGRDDEHISVEDLALQYYSQLGFKGYHCEGRIITTLFGLLCWDIIFAPIDGAFETPYQSAPLDIAEDTFFYSREDIAKARLRQLEEADRSAVSRMMEEAYTAHEKEMCVGVHWDMFEREDLIEIAECIGGSGLAVICQLLCEDYAGRTAGVPDLIVWNKDESSCKFVEVKSSGDKLQENQKVWIDVLIQANIPTEVCHVQEKGLEKPKKATISKANNRIVAAPSAGTKRKREELEESEDMLVESEDESEPDYLQLVNPATVVGESRPALPSNEPVEPPSPPTPRKLRQKCVVEVVITSPSPQRRRSNVSPEI